MPKFGYDSKLKHILDDPRARALIADFFGEEVLRHPLVAFSRNMTVKKALTYKANAVGREAEIDALVAKILSLD